MILEPEEETGSNRSKNELAGSQIQCRFGSFLLDTARRELLQSGEPVVIQARVFDLLAYLVSNKDRIVDKNELMDVVWSGRVVTEAALSQAVMKARVAVNDDADNPSIIKTIYGKGFRFAAAVEEMEVVAQRADNLPDRRFPSGLVLWSVISACLVALAIAILVFDLFRPMLASPEQMSGTQGTAANQRTLVEADTPGPKYPRNSIAVLPFVNMSDDAANEYFSDGISEELLNLLARVPELRVTSQTSAFSLKGKEIKVSDIARELNVAHVLEGSVRRAGNRVRITAQLVDARSDTHLWSETYDRTLDDIFAIQDEIAETVVSELKVALLGSAPTVTKTSPEAYTLFLQARRLGTRFTGEAFEQSNALYQTALEIDPGYAAAWSGLATNYANQTLLSFRFIDEGIGLAREAANRSLVLDPDYAPAHAQLSSIALRFDLDLDAATRHMERALELEPTNPEILRQAAVLDSSLGQLDAAIFVNTYVVGRDPINPVSHYYLGLSHLWAGHVNEAISSFRTAMMLNPDHASTHYRVGTALYLMGETEAALREMQQERGVTKRLMGEVMMRFALGDADASDAALAQLISEHERTTAYNIAYLKAFRGETDGAFEWLEKAVQYHDTGLPQIPYQPEFDGIRDDARWLPFLESIGMAPQQLARIEFNVTLPKQAGMTD